MILLQTYEYSFLQVTQPLIVLHRSSKWRLRFMVVWNWQGNQMNILFFGREISVRKFEFDVNKGNQLKRKY